MGFKNSLKCSYVVVNITFSFKFYYTTIKDKTGRPTYTYIIIWIGNSDLLNGWHKKIVQIINLFDFTNFPKTLRYKYLTSPLYSGERFCNSSTVSTPRYKSVSVSESTPRTLGRNWLQLSVYRFSHFIIVLWALWSEHAVERWEQ